MANYEEPVLKEGYLVKAPDIAKNLHVFKKWQKKWCRLYANGDLYYYDTEKASKPAGVLQLLQCYRMFEARSKGIHLSYCMGLEIASNIYYLKAESASIYNGWIKLLAEFAEISEVSEVSDSPPSQRRSTYAGGGKADQEDLRRGSSASIQSRHLSITAKAKFNTKEGWLAKTGSNNKGWKDRYFVLSHGKLAYFKSEKADSPLGAIDLFECTSLVATSGKKGYGFDIQVAGRLFNLSAENEEVQKDWFTAISRTLGVISSEFKEPSSRSRSGSSGSNISDASLGSQELLQEGTSGHLHTATPDRHLTVGTSSVELPSANTSSTAAASTHGAKKEDRDSVVQLLEVEVDALRTQVSSLESDLKATAAANSRLQDQLAESMRAQATQDQRSLEGMEALKAQVEQLSLAKEKLETINDSIQAQLEEQLDKVQLLEEELVGTKQELEEVNTSSTAAEEELAETQQRLHEIQDVARELEIALRKKGESEPATPLTMRKQSLSYSSAAKLESQLSASLDSNTKQHNAELSVNKTEIVEESKDLQDLHSTLQKIEKERDSLKIELESLKEAQNTFDSDAVKEGSASTDLGEERLKWQMEMENLRREYEARVGAEREAHSRETAALEGELAAVKQKCVDLEQSSKTQISELQENLTNTQSRIQQLEGEVSIHQQRVAQLQVEKEKALADLIAIRKINRSMEKRMNGSEVETRTGSPMGSPVSSTENPGIQHQLAEAERKLEEMKTALLEVMKERDLLKVQMERLLAGAPNGVQGQGVDLGNISQFFKSKTRATTAVSNESPSAPSHSPRTQTFRHSIKKVTQRPSLELAGTGTPPPKPKRPPKELVVRYRVQDQEQEEEVRPRTASILQTLFARR